MFTNDQLEALELLNSGEDIFLTGGAGTGKSYLLTHFIRTQEALKKKLIVCAPTGLAANHIEGVTVHRAFRLRLEDDLLKKKPEQELLETLSNMDIVIIDEISMVRMDLFDYVMTAILQAEKDFKVHIQKIVCGDFYQLPPIIDYKREEDALIDAYGESFGYLYAFQSDLWKFKMVELTEVVRQNDKAFVDALNKVRIGDSTGLQWIKDNCSQVPFNNSAWIVSRKKEASSKNAEFINKLDASTERIYEIKKEGISLLKSDIAFEDRLRLREATKVIILINSPTDSPKYYNGSFAEVISLYDDHIDIYLPETGEVVELRAEKQEVFGYRKNKVGEYEKYVIGSYTQIPVKPRYAITIHKSQGSTFDELNVSPAHWQPGMLYTVLSRVKSVDKLYLTSDVTKLSSLSSLSSRCANVVKQFYANPKTYKYDWNNEEAKRLLRKAKEKNNFGFMYAMSAADYNNWIIEYYESIKMANIPKGEEEFFNELFRRIK